MFLRSRRLRENKAVRDLVRETQLSPKDFILPVFVVEGENIKEEIRTIPDNYYYSVDRLGDIVNEVAAAGVPGIILFGVPDYKDEIGSSAFASDGIIQKAIRRIKKINSELLVITDVCMCEYTSHGHCGILKGHRVDNDCTLEYIAKIALSHAEAGADMVAPSDMMDGRVQAIRTILDENGYNHVSIMSYSAKYSSAFYGPFREAAGSSPSFGDRKGYQMDPGNRKEALKEMRADIEEGADIIMVKPALSYLDIIREGSNIFDLPMAAYSVSGEYAMVKAAAKAGLVDEKNIAQEILLSIKRAGADIIITYYALEVSKWLKE
jgi:porphobilinogen synthase